MTSNTTSATATGTTTAPSETVEIVKEGWIHKRGEHIKTWRPRYFVLKMDGSLVGYKVKPEDTESAERCNNFTVRGCQIITRNEPRPYTFLIRGLQSNTTIERMFCLEAEEDRLEWVEAINNVANKLNEAEILAVQSLDADVEVAAIAEDELLDQKFSLQGTSSNSGRRKVTFENFEFLKVLGKGNNGKVVLCREKTKGKLYAIKILKKENIIQHKDIKQIMAENRVLRNCNLHPFLISLKYAFQTADRLCFVMQYVNGGELYFHLKRERQFSEERTRFYGAEIVSALGYLHAHGVIHRDLKLENLLLDKDGHIKVADFGCCKEGLTYNGTTNTFCGTPEYLAPEIVEDNDYGRGVDWWATGVILYEMMIGRPPFLNENQKILFEQIEKEKVRFRRSISIEAESLLSGLLEKSPSRRLGCGPDDHKEIQRHKFFTSIDWNNLLKMTPPFKPQVTSDTDTRYFDSQFTGESVELTPPDPTAPLAIIDDKRFSQFSYQDLSSTMENHSSYLSGANPFYSRLQ